MEKVRIFIPTRDSARWVGAFLDAYRALGIEPLYIVDSRGVDETKDILQRKDADFRLFTPTGDFAESGMIEFGSGQSGAKWVLRLDDDEFPSRRLVEWMAVTPPRSLNQVFHISRHELFARDETIYCSRSPGKFHSFDRTLLHLQPRMHHVDRVSYIERLHTTGVASTQYTGFAPPDAYFIHLNCLLRSPSERLKKIRFYEAILPGATKAVADEYLPELFSLEHHDADRTGLDEFETLFASLPLQLNDTLDLDEATRCMFLEAVAAHIETVRLSQPPPFVNADRLVSFARFLPFAAWKKVAEFLCTIGAKRPGEALWNLEHYWRENGFSAPSRSAR